MDRRDPLNLKSLPDREPPEALWEAIESRLVNRRHHLRWLPVAAALLLAAGAGALFLGNRSDEARPDRAVEHYRLASVALERRVENLQTGVVDLRVLEQLSLLEDRLAWVDYLLAESPEDPVLWRHRLELLERIGDLYAGRSWMAQLEDTAI